MLESLDKLNNLYISCTRLFNMGDSAALVAHVCQLGVAGAETDDGDAATDQGDGIGAEIPKVQLFRGYPYDLLICPHEGLREGMFALELPGSVQGMVGEGLAGP